MSTLIKPTVLPTRNVSELDKLPTQEILNHILLQVEACGTDGLVSVAQGQEVFAPAEMRLLDSLERQGLIVPQITKYATPQGNYSGLRYRLSDEGKLRCKQLRQDQ